MVEPTQEYGFRDLGILQDFRRRYLEPGFSSNTNDLALAFQLYNLRRQYPADAAVSPELDRVFTNLITGQIQNARLQLDRLTK